MSSKSSVAIDSNLCVVFTGLPRNQRSKQSLSTGLLKLCGGVAKKANALYEKAPVRVAKNLTRQQAEATVKKFWSAGWHVDLYSGDTRVFSSHARENKVPETMRIDTGAGSLRKLSTAKDETDNGLKTVRLKRFYSKDKDVSLCIPLSWDAKNHLNNEAVLQLGCDQDETYVIIIPQAKQSFGAVVRLQEYANAIASAALGWVAHSALVEPVKYLEAERCYRAEIKGLVGATQVQYQITNYESRKQFYTIYVWTNIKRYNAIRPLINAICGSFKISEQHLQGSVKRIVR